MQQAEYMQWVLGPAPSIPLPGVMMLPSCSITIEVTIC